HIDGANCESGKISYSSYGTNSAGFTAATVSGFCKGVRSGEHTISVNLISLGGSCFVHNYHSGLTLEVEEVN
ncbi:MAG: hypothetical protein OQK13_01085, partial [Gammaproteobacteria bacterium]|nr:hypothetical protein [Gammaproteobacteria bacterium]